VCIIPKVKMITMGKATKQWAKQTAPRFAAHAQEIFEAFSCTPTTHLQVWHKIQAHTAVTNHGKRSYWSHDVCIGTEESGIFNTTTPSGWNMLQPEMEKLGYTFTEHLLPE